MSDNSEVVRRLFDAVERRDLDGLLALYHEEVSITEAASLPYGGTYRGHAGVREHALGFMRCWGPFQGGAEARLDPVFIQADDGTVAAVFRHRAFDTASGARFDGEEVGLYEIRDGKVARSQMFHADTVALLRFLEDHPVPRPSSIA